METLFVGRNIIFLPEVNSTNSYAINLLKNVKAAEGTVVHTANQTQGKGRRGNVWTSEPSSNLTASFIFKPSFLEMKKQFFLYQIAALACYDLMRELLNNGRFDIKIKWPNDLMVNNKKIAGILIENLIVNDKIAYSVIGIGINVRQRKFNRGINATSLRLLTGHDFETEPILKKLCVYLEKHYMNLKNNHAEKINSCYMDHFYKKNEWQNFEINGAVKNMLVKGTGANGLLLLEDAEGKKAEYDLNEVKWKMAAEPSV